MWRALAQIISFPALGRNLPYEPYGLDKSPSLLNINNGNHPAN